MKNKFVWGFLSALALITIVGCSSILDNNQGVFGKAQKVNQKVDTQIRATENQQAQANEDKLAHIGAWAEGGVEYSLDKLTNAPQEVTVAKQMNARVEALAGKPDFKEVEGIKGIVDDLLSQVDKTREDGEKALAAKDKQINAIQESDKKLDAQRESQISAALQQADANAKVADQYKATLSDMDKGGGLGAVWYGLHRFVVRAAWVLGIGGVLFLILRLPASANPIAGAIFAVFDQIGAWMVSCISVIFPKAVSLAGNVATSTYNEAKSALTTIVDSVETVKLQASSSGQPVTIQTLLNTAELSMTPADKALVENIKIQLGWIKPATATTVAPIIPATGSVVVTPVVPVVTPVIITSITSSLHT